MSHRAVGLVWPWSARPLTPSQPISPLHDVKNVRYAPGGRDKSAKKAPVMDTANLSVITQATATRLLHTDGFDLIQRVRHDSSFVNWRFYKGLDGILTSQWRIRTAFS